MGTAGGLEIDVQGGYGEVFRDLVGGAWCHGGILHEALRQHGADRVDCVRVSNISFFSEELEALSGTLMSFPNIPTHLQLSYLVL